MDLYSRSETRKRSVEVGSGIHMYLLGRSINKKKDFVGRNLGGKIFVSDSKQEKKIWPIQTVEKRGNSKLLHTLQSTRGRAEVVFPHSLFHQSRLAIEQLQSSKCQ